MAYNDEVIQALAWIRRATSEGMLAKSKLAECFNALDNAGVFQQIDEQTGYGESVSGDQGVVASVTAARVPNGLDPAEWGDLAFKD